LQKCRPFFYGQKWLKCRRKQGNVFSNVLTVMTTVDVVTTKIVSNEIEV
jgi:hypothetical protein